MYWKSLNGTQASIELVNATALPILADQDQEDDYLLLLSADDKAPADKVSANSEVSPEKIMRMSDSDLLFDAYIFIDWSASNRPTQGRDSIWIGEGYWSDNELVWGSGSATCINAPTRDNATIHIRERLYQHVTNRRRVLVCFDFPYAYPQCPESATFGADFGLVSAELSARIIDDTRNNSNRFQVASDLNEEVEADSGEGPFWGRPTEGYARDVCCLKTTKPTDWQLRESLKEFRVVEERLRNHGSRPFSVWQLFGNGSVGSQVLVGLPRVHSLTHDELLSEHSAVWPFETGWVTSFAKETRVVHAEFWPGAIKIDESLHPVRDASQVMSCVAWAASEDASGRLGAFFDPISENDPERELAMKEGWILGFTDNQGAA